MKKSAWRILLLSLCAQLVLSPVQARTLKSSEIDEIFHNSKVASTRITTHDGQKTEFLQPASFQLNSSQHVIMADGKTIDYAQIKRIEQKMNYDKRNISKGALIGLAVGAAIALPIALVGTNCSSSNDDGDCRSLRPAVWGISAGVAALSAGIGAGVGAAVKTKARRSYRFQ